MTLSELLETPNQVRQLAADMLTIAALFQGPPEPGIELVQGCLPGVLRYLADSGLELAAASELLQSPRYIVAAFQSINWPLDPMVLAALKQAESRPLLRRWSTILRALLASPLISEELERRAAHSALAGRDADEETDV